ncbi:LLM class flavin-dependent oxidoreductase [Sphingobium sp.]|uniref:LLM class flavin-dependent oxidoreductase n=1 Tax=Sphingobium sp. TaxID=1912891 RepID=UPI0028BD5BC4|nr:LLM class flavin-dependent oxidoreductase [Sphingobium sp.]
MELGFYTFADIFPDPHTGVSATPTQRMQELLELARLCDETGIDILGLGEHHGLEYVNSATATTIAAMAAATTRLRFTSATTLLSTADPVRTFQEFTTADLVSGGRVEIMFGRGGFTNNFSLFGYNLDDYDQLFAEKLDLFAQLNAQERVTWSGSFRSPLRDAEIAPRPSAPLPVWIAAGSPGSVVRAAMLGYPTAVPIIGGTFDRYAPTAELYRRAWRESGHESPPRLAIYSHLYLGETSQQAREDFYPYYNCYMQPFIRREVGRQQFAGMFSPMGPLVAGSPQEVIDRILAIRELTGATRYVGQMDIGGMPFAMVARLVELFAAKVAPVVRKETAA